MKKTLLSIVLTGFVLFTFGQNAWINELHYDNASSDVGEFIEIVIENPGSYALSDFAVYLYNGSSGAMYDNSSVDNFTVGTTVGNYTIYSWYPGSIQNGSPDALALTYQGAVITGQYLSYEGTLVATDGPANGMTSVDIGVEETSSTPAGESLQLSGGGTVYADFTWQDPAAETPGDENNNQSLGGTVTPSILNAYAISETAMDIEYSTDLTSVNAGDYALTGSSSITFSSATIDGSSSTLVHLTGASANMAGDITLDNIADAANTSNYDFYAGIMPISFVNTTNPGGTMNDVNIATFQGIVSANDNFNNVWVSDAAGAYNGVMIFSSSFDGLVAVGDEILFTANRATFYSLSELVDPELIFTLSTGNSPYGPSLIDGSDIDETIASDTDPGEMWEGQLITIEDFTVESYTDYDYRCSWSDGTTTYYFHVGDNVVYHFGGVSLNVGETYASITGVGDWYDSGPFYRINPRAQDDIIGGITIARIVGSFQGWNPADPEYVMSVNANNLLELTKNIPTGDNYYKVIEGDTWGDENFPASDEPLILTQDEYVTWKANIQTNLVIHAMPNVSGDFISELGGTDWTSDDPLTEMEDPEGDEIYTFEVMIPAGDYECKVTLNKNWNQSTGDNVLFTADGYNPTTFTYDFINNITTASVPPPPYVAVLTPNGGEYIEQGSMFEITWEYGFWEGDINIDLVKEGETPQPIVYNLPLSDGSFMWTVFESQAVGNDYKIRISGVNDEDPVGESDDYFSIIEPYVLPNIVITEIMYNPPEFGDDTLEFLEFYNNSAETISMDGFYLSEGVEYTFPAGIEILPDTFLVVAKDSVALWLTFGVEALQWFSGSLSNGGESVELKDNFDIVVDFVPYDDYQPWDTLADGFGPSLTLCNPDADNAIAENWRASEHLMAINTDGDSIWATPGFECQISLIAGFTSDQQVVIVGDSVMFTDQTTGNSISWSWTFEGGTPETFEGQNPPYIVYNQAGMWDVTLVVSDGANTDSLTYEDYIHSGYAPAADFEAEETQVLAGSFTNFTSLSTGENLTFEWTFEGGTPDTSAEENPAEIYYLIMDWDTYDVTLVVTNEFGSDTLTKEDYIEVIPENIYEKILTNLNVNLFPNPNEGNFTLSIPANADAEVKIIDLQGRQVFYEKISGSQQINVDVFKKGIYIVKIFDTESGSQVIKRLVIR